MWKVYVEVILPLTCSQSSTQIMIKINKLALACYPGTKVSKDFTLSILLIEKEFSLH